MRKLVVWSLVWLMAGSICHARDFIVEFVEENYREAEIPYSHEPQIYHSIQIRSDAGPKLLILTGEDMAYREWLRHYIAENKTFIARIPESDNDRFISAKAYEMDVTAIHPFNGKKWAPGTNEKGPVQNPAAAAGSRVLHGDRHILVVDTNTKRTRLITAIINRMGYTAMISHNGPQALNTFRIQPEKFKMVIAHHQMPGMPAEKFVGQLLRIDHQIPILVETGYNNPTAKKRFISEFSGAGTVMVRSVVLNDLQKTIKDLVREDPKEKGTQPGPGQGKQGKA